MPLAKPLPKPVPQLEKDHAPNANCGPASAAVLLDYASSGMVRKVPEEVRKKMGAGHKTGFTSLADAKRAIRAFQGAFKSVGFEPPEPRYHHARPFDRLLKAIANGRVAQVGIVYGVVRKQHPELWSVSGFTGRHFVTVVDVTPPGAGNRTALVYDPLADGRPRPGGGGHYKRGPQDWPLQMLRDATDAYVMDLEGNKAANHKAAADSRASWVSVKRAKELTGEAVDDPETALGEPELRTRVKALKQRLRALRDELEARDERVSELEQGLADIGSLSAATAIAKPTILDIQKVVDALVPTDDSGNEPTDDSGAGPDLPPVDGEEDPDDDNNL